MNCSQFFRGCFLLFATALLAVSMSFAQNQGGGGGGNTGGGNTGGGNTGGNRGTGNTSRGTSPIPNTTNRQQQQQQQFPEVRRPVFLQGKVIFDDGTPAPPSVVIERFCAGQTIPEGYTDSKGRFSFEVGRNANVMADASTSGLHNNPMSPGGPFSNSGGFGSFGRSGIGRGVSERDLSGCELRARLGGYRSSSIELTGHRMFDNPNVGTIILKKIGNVEGLTISMTSMQAPKKAKKAFQNGIKAAKKKKFDKAEEELRKAVEIYAKYAEAWYALGQVYLVEKNSDQARDSYHKAIGADAKYMRPYIKLATLDAQVQKWPDVAATTQKVLKMNPYDFPEAYYLNSMANLNMNNHFAAAKSAREAIKMNYSSHRPQVEQILGLALAYQNNYSEAAEHLKKYLELAPNARNATMVQKQLTQIEKFLGEHQPTAEKQ